MTQRKIDLGVGEDGLTREEYLALQDAFVRRVGELMRVMTSGETAEERKDAQVRSGVLITAGEVLGL